MKKSIFIGTVLALTLLVGIPGLFAFSSYGRGYCGAAGADYPQQSSGWGCPGMGQRYGGGYCSRAGYGAWNRNTAQPLTRDQATELLETYGNYKDNPNVKLKDMVDKGDFFEATIVTKEGSLVDKIDIDKHTGSFRRTS